MSDSKRIVIHRHAVSRRFLRWLAVALAVVAVLSLAAWLAQRSLRSASKKRALQSWLDEKLNADVSHFGEMGVRLNLVRDSRLVLHNVEIEHPSPLFPGKLAIINRLEARIRPLSFLGAWPGPLHVLLRGCFFSLEQNDSGEWSTHGLLRPLTTTDVPFPFLVPRIAGWKAEVRDSSLTVRRHGYELNLGVDAEVAGRVGHNQLTLRAKKTPMTVAWAEELPFRTGSIGPAVLVAERGREPGDLPTLVPGRCEVKTEGFPVLALPFLIPGIPLHDVPGVFNGQIRYIRDGTAVNALTAEGELLDVPLTVFGLPRHVPVRLHLPVSGGEARASLRMGPSGYGAIEMAFAVDGTGRARPLTLRSDVAALDDIPSIFSRHSYWPDWLSRTFSSVEWRAASWLGFGWNGTNLRLHLSRHTAGLSLSGEAELLNGRVRVAMSPDQRDEPVILAAERLDAGLVAAKLSALLPRALAVGLTGSHVNLTWQGFYRDGEIREWGGGMVFARPVVDVRTSGEWWRCLGKMADAIARELPDWGGGDAAELGALVKQSLLPFDQLSVVAERDEDGHFILEFRAYGDAVGQATGVFDRLADGSLTGEFLLAGPSRLLDAAASANPELGTVLRMLANDSLGLRVTFAIPAGGSPEFTFPFLEDAVRLRAAMQPLEGHP